MFKIWVILDELPTAFHPQRALVSRKTSKGFGFFAQGVWGVLFVSRAEWMF